MPDPIHLRLFLLNLNLAICRLPADAEVPEWAAAGAFSSVTRTSTELSIVCAQSAVPDAIPHQPGWRIFQVQGPLDFALTGILASIAQPLAEAGVSIFAVSTFDTDYVMVRATDIEAAVNALRAAGHQVENIP